MNKTQLKDNVIKFRRDLHKIPELDFDLPKTTRYLLDYLEKLPCTITKIGKASFTAFFDIGSEETIAFRTDMDALPIQEKALHSFASTHKGHMHACGHDGHMSIMLGFASEVARIISLQNDSTDQVETADLKKNVLLVFQAAEETTGGAYEICQSGIFEKYKTKKIFGLHIWPEFPKNTIVCRPGAFMAGTKVLWINIHGKSSHIAKPEEGIDALDIGTQLVQAIYKMEREEIPEDVSRILKFGEFKSGTGVNILSDKTYIGGTTRFYDNEIVNKILGRIKEICAEYESKYGCSIEFETSRGYPPVINPTELVEELIKAVEQMDVDNGINFFPLEKPFLTAEDFAEYQQTIPGLFFFLGTGLDLSLHNENYDINEEVLPTGVEIFKQLLLNN